MTVGEINMAKNKTSSSEIKAEAKRLVRQAALGAPPSPVPSKCLAC